MDLFYLEKWFKDKDIKEEIQSKLTEKGFNSLTALKAMHIPDDLEGILSREHFSVAEIRLVEKHIKELQDVQTDEDSKDTESLLEKNELQNNNHGTKKTLTSTLFNASVFSANASQLYATLKHGPIDNFFYFNVIVLAVCIMLQISLGILLIIISKTNSDRAKPKTKAWLLFWNDAALVGAFLVTLLNIILASFNVAGNEKPV